MVAHKVQQEITLGSPKKNKPQAIERLILDIQRRRVIKASEMECGERGDTAELNRLQVSYSCIALSEVCASCIALSEVRAPCIAFSEVRASSNRATYSGHTAETGY